MYQEVKHILDHKRVKYLEGVEAKVQGTIFFINEWDHVPNWDYPDQKKALEEKGIPSICFKEQKYLLSDPERGRLKTSTEEFVKGIGGGAGQGK